MGLFESAIQEALAPLKPSDNNRAQKLIDQSNARIDRTLADPGLLDRRAADISTQITPVLAKPKYTKFANKTDAVDATLPKDHPMAGISTKLKTAYQMNLERSLNTGKSQAQIEREAFAAVVTPEIVEKTHEYQFKQDSSLKNAFGIFGNSKSGTKPLPGYEEYKARAREKSKSSALQFDLASPEAVKEGLVGGAAMAGFSTALGIGGAVLAGTLAAPATLAAIGTAAVVSGLAAIPATIAARKVQSVAENSDWQAANPDSALPHIAGGIVGAAGGGGLAAMATKGIIGKVAIKRLAAEAAEALVGGAKAKVATGVAGALGAATGGAVGYENPALALDLATFVGVESLVKAGGKAALTKMIEKSMLSEGAMKAVMANPTGENIVNMHRSKIAAKDAAVLEEALTKEEMLKASRLAEERANYFNEMEVEREATRLARPQFNAGEVAAYNAGQGLESDVVNRTIVTTSKKGKVTATALGTAEDDLIIRGLAEKGLIADSENIAAKAASELSEEGFAKILSPETATLKAGTLDEKISVELQMEHINKRVNVIAAAENRLHSVKRDLLDSVGEGAETFNPSRQMEAIRAKNNAYGNTGEVDAALLNEDLAVTGAGNLGKHVQNLLGERSGKFEKIAEATYRKQREEWKKKVGITAAGLSALMLPVQEAVDADNDPNIELTFTQKIGQHLQNSAIANLLSPSEAEAGIASTVTKAGLTIPKALETYFTTAFGKGTKALQAVVDAGLVGKPLERNALTMRGTLPTGDFSTVPSKTMIREVFSEPMAVSGNSAMTPMGRANLVSKSILEGEGADRITTGLAPVELAYRMTEATNNASKGFEMLGNAERILGINMGKDSVTKEILDYMKPIQDETREVFKKQQVLEHTYVELTSQERILNKLIKKGKTVDSEGAPVKTALDDVLAKKESILKEIKLGEEGVSAANAQVYKAYEELASKHVRTRIALAAEDSFDYKKYPFLKTMLTENEKAYVNVYKDYMNHMAERIEAAGGKAIRENAFVHHSLQKTEAFEKGNETVRQMLEDFNIKNADVVLANSKFFQRTKYSQNYVPDIKYNTAEYVQDAEKRIAGMKFWRVGKDDGWDAVRKSSIVQNSKKLSQYFEALDDGMRPVEQSFLNTAADNYSKLEVIRLLGGSVSAPFKHLLKLQADAATYGAVNTLGTIPEALGVSARNFVRNTASKLVEAKWIDSHTADMLWKDSKVSDGILQSMTSQKNMINYMSELEQSMGNPYKGAAAKFVDGLSNAAGIGIKAVESFDRTLTVLVAAKMAAKNGMTAQQAVYGSYETMLLNNFMGGALNSAWGRDPKVRAALLFQNTPFKIWERRLVAAMNMGKDLKTAAGMIKNGKLEQEWQALQKIKGDMKEGEYKFKAGILFDAVTASRNAFGNSSSGILVKELMGIGAIMYGSSAIFGVDMAPQFLHLPFLKTEGGTAELTTSPLIQATMKTAAGTKPYGVDETEWDEENKPFFLSTFFNHWKGSSGYSLFASKMGRITEDDIPDMYGSSVGKYLFALKNKE